MYIFLCCIVFYVPCISTIYVPIYIIHTTTYIRKALLDIYWHYHIAQLCQFLSSQQTIFFNTIPCLTQFCLNADFALLWFLVENLLCKIFPMPEFLQNPKLM